MSKVQMLRALVEQRLAAAAEEIFGLFEGTIAEYEEELSRSKEENERQRRLLDAVFLPEVRIHRADVQQLLLRKEQVLSEQQDWSSSRDQEDPELPHIKEEQEELWTSQEGEKLQGLEEADVKYPLTLVKSEEDDDEEKTRSSGLPSAAANSSTEHMETEADEEDCGGPEPARNSERHSDSKQEEPSVFDPSSPAAGRRLNSPPQTPPHGPLRDPPLPARPATGEGKLPAAVSGISHQMTQFPAEVKPQFTAVNSRFLSTEERTAALEAKANRGPSVEENKRKRRAHNPTLAETVRRLYNSKANCWRDASEQRMKSPHSEAVTAHSIEAPAENPDVHGVNNDVIRDVQQLLESKERVPFEQQDWSSSLDQEGREPLHIKEEQEELWTSQEGEQLQGLEEADIKYPLTLVPVKSEEDDDEEKTRSSGLPSAAANSSTEHMETEADEEDCGGPEPARNSHSYLQPDTDDKTGDSSDPETDDSADWQETREPRSTLKALNNDEIPDNDFRCSSTEKPFRCSECRKTFRTRGNLKRHMKTHTGERPFSCSVCKKSFTRRQHLQRHMQSHTGEKPFSCSVCKKKYVLSHTLKRHMRTHREETEDQGDPEPPHIRKEKEEHWTSQEGEQLQGLEEADSKIPLTLVPVKSEENEEKLQTSGLLSAAAVSSTEYIETEAFEEDCGGPEPARNSYLQPDSDDTTGDSSDPETDDSADWQKTKRPRLGLKADEITDSDFECNSTEKSFRCTECRKTFIHRADLKRHMRTHAGEKPFSCSVCKQSFARSENLQRHMRIHTEEKAFRCSICKKSFTLSQSLQKHMRTHTGEKPFNCSVCKNSFARSENLQIHMRIHTGEKPFSCSVCGKRFVESRDLKKHMRTHTGEKPYSCSLCKKTFTLSHHLQRHQKTHRGEKV